MAKNVPQGRIRSTNGYFRAVEALDRLEKVRRRQLARLDEDAAHTEFLSAMDCERDPALDLGEDGLIDSLEKRIFTYFDSLSDHERYPHAAADLCSATKNREWGFLAWTLFRGKFPAPPLQTPALRAGVFLFDALDSEPLTNVRFGHTCWRDFGNLIHVKSDPPLYGKLALAYASFGK